MTAKRVAKAILSMVDAIGGTIGHLNATPEVTTEVAKQLKKRQRTDKDRERDRIYNAKRPNRCSRTKQSESVRGKVRYALKVGRLVKPAMCERCTATNIAAHHDSHSRPLAVSWLCPRHHAARHVELGRVGKRKSRRLGRKNK